jgi:hypothetical protein
MKESVVRNYLMKKQKNDSKKSSERLSKENSLDEGTGAEVRKDA